MKRTFTTTLLITVIGVLSIFAQERIYTPELSLPANGAIDQMPDVVLDWNAVTGGGSGIIRYDIQLDTDPAFSNPVSFETEFLSAVQTSELIFGETYFWRVRAKDGDQISNWTEPWSFRVIRRIILVKPTDASNQKTDVEIGWNALSGITSYEYQIDTAYYWKGIASGLSGHINATSVVDENNAWLVGAGGKILYWDGSTMTEQTSPTGNDLFGVSFVDATNGWAAGKGGKILYFNGTEWTEQASQTTKDLKAVSFTDASNGWAVGTGGVIQYFNGTEWSSAYTASADLNGVFALDNSHVWAVGKSGVIVFFNGSSWSTMNSGSTRELMGVSFMDADNGFAVGKTGTILQFVNGEWITITQSLSTRDFAAVTYLADDNAWIVGRTGTVLQYDGIEWFSQTSGTNANLLSIDFGASGGFIAGENGTAVRFNDDAFSSPLAVIHAVSPDIITTKLIDLYFGTQFFWRMRAVHGQDISGWSGARSFTTIATVELDKPNNNATDQALDVLLKWDKITDLVTYEIQLDDDPDFGSPVLLATSNIEKRAELLKFGVTYNWRARALHAHDTSVWSEPWTFTTLNSVTLTAPANNATNTSLSPLLDWATLTGITGYQVQLSGDNTFASLIAEGFPLQAESQFTTPVVLDRETTYWWRARAINGLDSSNWSPVWSFVTQPPVGIEEPGFEQQLQIYPNPADNTLFIQWSGNSSLRVQLSVTDIVGKTVLNREIILDGKNKSVPVDVAGLKNGMYMIRMADQENTLTRKLIIRK